MLTFDDSTVRLSVFISVLLICVAIEAVLPCKQRTQQRTRRWFTNMSLVVIGSIVVRFMGIFTALSVAVWAEKHHWGLFSFIDLPVWLEVTCCVILLDLAVYIQHVASHKIPVLWKVHRTHHADRDIDATTGIRFHPVEIALSMLYKCVVVLLLGPSAFAVFLFEVILNASAMFNHMNAKLPKKLDTALRKLIITPDFHRVHHSVIPRETDSNYGFCLSVWDKLFKTYIPQPEKGHDQMLIGLNNYQTSKPTNILWCLKLPFSK